MAAPPAVCIYPLSPTYLPFHRYLYYASLILSVLYPTPPPLIKGAFAYSLTYSGTASLYAILIIGFPTRTTINLDIFALWSVLSPASILVLPLLNWNRNLQSPSGRSARSIVRIWGIWISIGAICTIVTLIRSKKLAHSGASMTVADCQALVDMEGAAGLKLRNPNSFLLGDYERVFGDLFSRIVKVVSPLVFVPLFFGLIACIMTIIPTGHKAQIEEWASISAPGDEGTVSILSAFRSGYLFLQKNVLGVTPALLIAAISINEIYLLKNRPVGIPESEDMYEIGQWGLLAGLGLLSGAAAVNSMVNDLSGQRKIEVVLGGENDDLANIV